ncbi:M20/M25/M40 family metallo-hydrolase [Psychroserpens jangbogonensis]|uniref:M20/M25/M40 family metallo-hydrolase n=1 Tax=Psychroserpens jangbogonensis TaxID=1484460 RepID=UPI00053EAE4F|nr:M20/M25/M40 family metallo-hydrolase [Psychroserpens jangbogonensis]
MKYTLSLCLLLLILSCKTKIESEPVTITSTEVREMVSFLASDDLLGRYAGSEGIDKAATYIENQFESYGVKPYFKTYRDHFKIDSLDAFNVVGFIEGTDDVLKKEVIILGAHYDHIGYGNGIKKHGGKLTEKDSLANGANDNASGTAAIIAYSKYFAQSKSNKRSIMFTLFSAEEMGLLGSKHLAKRLKSENLNLYAMVNLEMVGVPLKNKDYEVFLSGYELSNMAEKMNSYIKQSNYIGSSEVAIKYQLFKRSDNYPFYNQFKVPCQSISSCDLSNFDYYHHADDEIGELNFEFMASVINKTIPAIEQMSNTETKEIVMYEQE